MEEKELGRMDGGGVKEDGWRRSKGGWMEEE